MPILLEKLGDLIWRHDCFVISRSPVQVRPVAPRATARVNIAIHFDGLRYFYCPKRGIENTILCHKKPQKLSAFGAFLIDCFLVYPSKIKGKRSVYAPFAINISFRLSVIGIDAVLSEIVLIQ